VIDTPENPTPDSPPTKTLSQSARATNTPTNYSPTRFVSEKGSMTSRTNQPLPCRCCDGSGYHYEICPDCGEGHLFRCVACRGTGVEDPSDQFQDCGCDPEKEGLEQGSRAGVGGDAPKFGRYFEGLRRAETGGIFALDFAFGFAFALATSLDSARVGATKERGRVTRQPILSDLTFTMLAGPGPRPAPAGCGAEPHGFSPRRWQKV